MMGATRGHGGSGVRPLSAVLLCAMFLAGCEGASLPSLPKLQDINPFAEKETPRPGRRIPGIKQKNVPTNLAAPNNPTTLPPPRQTDTWSQPGAVASNSPGHLILGGALKNPWARMREPAAAFTAS